MGVWEDKMIGTLGEIYAGKAKYGMTDAEIFSDIENHNYNNDVLNSLGSFTNRDFLDISELEQELAEVLV